METKALTISLTPECCTMAAVLYNEQLKILLFTELVTVQLFESDIHAFILSVGEPNICFNKEIGGVSVIASPLDDASQQAVPNILRLRSSHCFYYFLLGFYTGERHINDSMRKELPGPHKGSDIYAAVCNDRSYANNRAHSKKQQHPKVYFLRNSLGYVRMDILLHLPKQGKATNAWFC